ncbi:MAG: alanine/glycine:cation symporter family protein [Planctomycetaceae bacterium]
MSDGRCFRFCCRQIPLLIAVVFGAGVASADESPEAQAGIQNVTVQAETAEQGAGDSKSAAAQEQLTIEQQVDAVFGKVNEVIAFAFFYPVPIVPDAGGWRTAPFAVVWLVMGAIFCTLRMRFINLRAFIHAVQAVLGKFDDPGAKGEVSHFQALTAALSATVGLGNIAGVAIAVSLGGPGATFWMIVAGFLGMSSKFVECTLGQKYRQTRPDGRVMGGAMFYLSDGLAEIGLKPLGKVLAFVFTILCIGGSFGGGCTFQVNQSLEAVGETIPFLRENNWIYGLLMTVAVGVVIIGGIRSIARVAEKIVPAMCAVYLLAAVAILATNFDKVPWAMQQIIDGAFHPSAAFGGLVGVLITGFKRAAFSNEAGVGSAAIAHSAAKTDFPVREGIVALLEPFIDTVVICTMTALVIVISGAFAGEFTTTDSGPVPSKLAMEDPGVGYDIQPGDPEVDEMRQAMIAGKGAKLTSMVMDRHFRGFKYILAVSVVLFAYSTMISWSYYGERCWAYLFGDGTSMVYRVIFLVFVFLGSIVSAKNVLDFGDLMILGMALPNILGILLLSGVVARELNAYWQRVRSGDFSKAGDA